ncbi:hypothetical protein L195_g060278, partial [Trifolium pratense]
GVCFAICHWLGISRTFQKEGVSHLEQFEGLIGSGRAFSKCVGVKWFACVWTDFGVYGKQEKRKQFHNKETKSEKMQEVVKVYSWNWLYIRSNNMKF